MDIAVVNVSVISLPMLMKSDLYWQVMPKPKSLQKPVSFLITYRKEENILISTHTHRDMFVHFKQLERRNISKPLSNVAPTLRIFHKWLARVGNERQRWI